MVLASFGGGAVIFSTHHFVTHKLASKTMHGGDKLENCLPTLCQHKQTSPCFVLRTHSLASLKLPRSSPRGSKLPGRISLLSLGLGLNFGRGPFSSEFPTASRRRSRHPGDDAIQRVIFIRHRRGSHLSLRGPNPGLLLRRRVNFKSSGRARIGGI